MSIANYLSIAHKISRLNQERRSNLLREDVDVKDDNDAFAGEMISSLWDVPDYPDNWKSEMRFDLSNEQAVSLRDKIITSPHSKDSLFAHLLANHLQEACACNSFEDLASIDMPSDIRADYNLAVNFARLIYRSRICILRQQSQYDYLRNGSSTK